MPKHWFALIFTVSLATATNAASADDVAIPHVKATWCAVGVANARALAETLAAARQVYSDELGFDMPETVNLSITCGSRTSAELFNDGHDQIFLSLSSLEELAPPSKSGVFNLYGMCHELGHLAMSRALKDRDWMTGAAAEGWAHYIGSLVVDRVYAAKGESLWPTPYDYRQDGTIRLEKGLAAKTPSEEDLAAAQWRKLEPIIGLRGFAQLFAAWQSAAVDPVRPSQTLLATLNKLRPEDRAALSDWWNSAAPLFVERLQVSEFPPQQVSPSSLSGQPVKLVFDHGTEDSKRSFAGAGHGRKFRVPGEGDWYITAVWVYGARYGDEKPPDTAFDVALSDDQAKLIAIWKKPYASFKQGDDAWVRLDVPPTRVPQNFYVTLNFRASASNGVYVGLDSSTKGNSISSIPGKPPYPFTPGDWMIRVELDHLR